MLSYSIIGEVLENRSFLPKCWLNHYRFQAKHVAIYRNNGFDLDVHYMEWLFNHIRSIVNFKVHEVYNIYLKCDTNGQFSARLYNKGDDFNLVFLNFPYLCNYQ
jgi:hypothetical protein